MLINNLIPSFVRIIKCIHCLRKMRLYMNYRKCEKTIEYKVFKICDIFNNFRFTIVKIKKCFRILLIIS